MTVILPDENVNLQEIEYKINAKVLSEIFLESTFSIVNIELPKFKIEFKTEVNYFSKLIAKFNDFYSCLNRFQEALKTWEPLIHLNQVTRIYLKLATGFQYQKCFIKQ